MLSTQPNAITDLSANLKLFSILQTQCHHSKTYIASTLRFDDYVLTETLYFNNHTVYLQNQNINEYVVCIKLPYTRGLSFIHKVYNQSFGKHASSVTRVN